MPDFAPQIGELPQEQVFKFPDGKKGNIATINFMIKVARERAGHPIIRHTALKILEYNQIPSQDHAKEALALGDFVKEHVTYRRDPEDVEYLQDPIMLIDQINRGVATGDCDDMSLLIATLLLATGGKPFFRAVRYDSIWGNYNHIYVVAYEQNWREPVVRIVLDGILKRYPIGTEVPHKSGDEFPV
jgi:hypothetical protein